MHESEGCQLTLNFSLSSLTLCFMYFYTPRPFLNFFNITRELKALTQIDQIWAQPKLIIPVIIKNAENSFLPYSFFNATGYICL